MTKVCQKGLTESSILLPKRKSAQTAENKGETKWRKSGRSAIVFETEKTRRVKTEESPREHRKFSHIIASSSTVFCSTGTI
jgi:hypothetical protein